MTAQPQPSQRILLFGASTPSGAAFRELAAGRDLVVVGRRCPADWPAERFLHSDLCAEPLAGLPPGGVIVSFAPLWHLAPSISNLLESARSDRGRAEDLPSAVVACSSSSVLTKRFAANAFDQALVARLSEAETRLEQACQAAAIPCRIVRPTLIYGEAGGYGDRNLSVLLKLMGRWPVVPIPARTGQRQPIHARQLAAVTLRLADRPDLAPSPLNLGGDEALLYATMLRRLRDEALRLDPRDPARRCHLVPVPMTLFHLLAAPLLLLNPKLFEAVLRIETNLSGFTPAHTLLDLPPQPFPLSPLARP